MKTTRPKRQRAVTLDDLVRMQDLTLMGQARGIDLDSRDARVESRNRLQEFFLRLQPLLKPDFSLEIGAYSAAFSVKMSRLGIDAHAFEANPYNHVAFREKVARRAPNLKYRHLAVSDRDGEVTFQVKQSQNGQAVNKAAVNNSLLMRTDASYEYESVTVPSVRLDSYLKAEGLAGRSFSAWIDVEGALGTVTAGFGDALKSCLSLIVEVEEHGYWQDQMLAIDAMRYFASQGLVPVARDFEAKHQYNLVYLNGEALRHPQVRLALLQHLQGV